jgi:hypothetical protein
MKMDSKTGAPKEQKYFKVLNRAQQGKYFTAFLAFTNRGIYVFNDGP